MQCNVIVKCLAVLTIPDMHLKPYSLLQYFNIDVISLNLNIDFVVPKNAVIPGRKNAADPVSNTRLNSIEFQIAEPGKD